MKIYFIVNFIKTIRQEFSTLNQLFRYSNAISLIGNLYGFYYEHNLHDFRQTEGFVVCEKGREGVKSAHKVHFLMLSYLFEIETTILHRNPSVHGVPL